LLCPSRLLLWLSRLSRLCWKWMGIFWSCERVGRNGAGRAWGLGRGLERAWEERNVHNIAVDANILLFKTIMIKIDSVLFTMGLYGLQLRAWYLQVVKEKICEWSEILQPALFTDQL